MINQIKKAAKSVGIYAVVTNSEERIETQLNSLTREENLPILLISWDINVLLDFDSFGVLKNPNAQVVALLVRKPEDMTKESAEETSKDMATLFEEFIQVLYNNISPLVKLEEEEKPIFDLSFKYVPKHGAGKHSGIMARWTQKEIFEPQCN